MDFERKLIIVGVAKEFHFRFLQKMDTNLFRRGPSFKQSFAEKKLRGPK